MYYFPILFSLPSLFIEASAYVWRKLSSLEKAQRQKQILDLFLLQWSDDVFLGCDRLQGAHSGKTVICMTTKI